MWLKETGRCQASAATVDSLSEKEVPAAKPFHIPDLFRIGMYEHVSLAAAALRCHKVLNSTVKFAFFLLVLVHFLFCVYFIFSNKHKCRETVASGS